MATVSGISAVGQEEFLQLLVAQLQNQDPLDPVKDTEFIAQLASFSTLSGITELNASFSEILKLQQLTQGTDLVGKTVQYTASGSSTVETGKVDSLTVESGKVVLNIGNTQVGLDQIKGVVAS